MPSTTTIGQAGACQAASIAGTPQIQLDARVVC
jgi:hypothetical protein